MSDEHTYKLIYFNARGRAEHIRYIFAYTGIEYTDERIPEELWPEYKDCKREESIFTFIVQLSDICHLLKLFCIFPIDRFLSNSTQCSYEPCLFLAMPYKKLPVLEIDGKPVAQSNAVARYLARKYDLMGKDEWDAMICDELVDTLGDLKQGNTLLVRSNIEESKENEEIVGTMRGYSFFHTLFSLRLGGKTQMNVTVGFIYVSDICYYRMEENPEKKEARKNQLLNETIPFYLTKFDQIIGKNKGYIIPSTTTWADFVFAAALENYEYMFGAPALDKYPALRALKKRIHRIPAISDWLIRRPFTNS
ncbi:hematopoietic prostaglandin D synthase-like [Bombus vosnesenskii]|uniref:glutathione transferase n=3 Tax=Bombus vosnesenskii TaxID=207650 RepID=A0A6J3LCM9_9HYME|nr:hematopoietic prostaglandin D synthase-like [Bombus vosnesenskii]